MTLARRLNEACSVNIFIINNVAAIFGFLAKLTSVFCPGRSDNHRGGDSPHGGLTLGHVDSTAHQSCPVPHDWLYVRSEICRFGLLYPG